MLKWSKIFFCAAAFFCLIATVVVIWGACLPAGTNPDTHFIAYLNDIGFEAFFFFAAIIGVEGLWLRSNALSDRRDEKALKVDLSMFHTSRGYNIGALCIIAIVAVLYILLW